MALHFPMRLEMPMRGQQGPYNKDPTRCRTDVLYLYCNTA
jgi:hypothetical protein